MYNTDGSQGAARGAGVGAGIYADIRDAFIGLEKISSQEPDPKLMQVYGEIYQRWKTYLDKL